MSNDGPVWHEDGEPVVCFNDKYRWFNDEESKKILEELKKKERDEHKN